MHQLQILQQAPYLTLTLQQEDDAPALFDLVQQEKTRLRETLAWPDSVREVKDTLATIQQNRKQFFSGLAAVYLIHWQGELAGVASFNSINDKQGEIGYWIAQRFEGCGIAHQALRCLINSYADAGLIDTFIIKASTANPRSNALAQRLGFTFLDRLPAAEKIGERCYDQNRYRYQRGVAR